MGGNPKKSPWSSTTQAMRKRKKVQVTLADAERDLLDGLTETLASQKSLVAGAALRLFASASRATQERLLREAASDT